MEPELQQWQCQHEQQQQGERLLGPLPEGLKKERLPMAAFPSLIPILSIGAGLDFLLTFLSRKK
jgi:hypothetical protein